MLNHIDSPISRRIRGSRGAQNEIFLAVHQAVTTTELFAGSRKGAEKKEMAKRILRELIDIKGAPDWIEDACISFLIDVAAGFLFTMKPARS